MTSSGIWIFDIETDGLDPTKIHVLSVSNLSGSITRSTNNYDEMRRFFLNAKAIIGHNIARYDVPVVERLLDIKIEAKKVDTLPLSWVLYPERKKKHGLADWGEDVGIPKPEIDDWENLSYEEYEYRCRQDVEITRRLWAQIYEYLFDLYGDKTRIWKYLDYISFKMYCAMLQEKSRWHVDIEKADAALEKLLSDKEIKTVQLGKIMPVVKHYREKTKPKRFLNKDGEYTKLGLEWLATLSEQGLPADYDGTIQIWTHDEEPNPNSPEQLKSWLTELGWVPQTFKQVKDKKTGKIREVPQINLDQGRGLCPSVQALFEKEPRLEVLAGLSVISHRIGVINGIIKGMVDGTTVAQVQGLTNTLRFKHTTVVNLPKVTKPYAADIRGSLIAPPGYILCGSDMASLEDRIKQHFIYKYDPDYVNSMNQPDFDPHLTVAGLAGMLTQEQITEYKWMSSLTADELAVADKVKISLIKSYKPIRDIAKNGNYACQYGAGIPRLMVTCVIDRPAATRLFDAYWELNWAVKKVASVQTVKTVNDQMWLLNPISGFYYSLRAKKDIFSTLVQGTASYVFDEWVRLIVEKRPQLTAQFHDEIVLLIKEGFEDKCTKLIESCISELNNTLKLDRELGISIQYGHNYGQIH